MFVYTYTHTLTHTAFQQTQTSPGLPDLSPGSCDPVQSDIMTSEDDLCKQHFNE